MSLGRILSSVAASAAVAGCAVVAFGMAGAQVPKSAQTDGAGRNARPVAATHTARPAVRDTSGPAAPIADPTSAGPTAVDPVPVDTAPVDTATGGATPAVQAPTVAARPATHGGDAVGPVISEPTVSPAATGAPAAKPAGTTRPAAPTVARHTVAPAAKPHHVSAPKPAPKPATKALQKGAPLPLHFKTYHSTRVLTVRAYSHSSTTAVLQAWSKAPGGGWLRHGDSVTAHVGAAGIGPASEYTSKTPAGAFTITQAFGHNSDPGTRLPYLHTKSSDWWISQPGRLYNTHQRCSSNCGFTRGSPNEHLYYETPYYNYAMVIDYNTHNAPGGVRAGKGSAFFLHVTDGAPTAGCVSVSQDKLTSIMRWLRPYDHPRILIGVT